MIVEGPAGIGKTALLGAAGALARDRAAIVLAARGAPLERSLSYGVVRQLFEPAALGSGGLESGELFAGAAALAMRAFADEPSQPASPEDVSFATLHGLYWLTANLASRELLLLLVDDCHCVDGPSLRFLAHLGARLEGLPVFVLATVRDGDRAIAPDLLDEFLSLTSETLRPSPLCAGAAARIVRTQLGGATGRFCRACHAATGGNPLFLRALIASFVADGGEPGDDAAGRVTQFGVRSVARLLAKRLAFLPREPTPSLARSAFSARAVHSGSWRPLPTFRSSRRRSSRTACGRPGFWRRRLGSCSPTPFSARPLRS